VVDENISFMTMRLFGVASSEGQGRNTTHGGFIALGPVHDFVLGIKTP